MRSEQNSWISYNSSAISIYVGMFLANRSCSWRGRISLFPPSLARQRLVARSKLIQLLLFQLFKVQYCIVSVFCNSDQLVKLDLNSLSIAVLGILNEKYHEERHNRRCCVYYQLPRVTEMEDGTGDNPRGDKAYRQDKGDWTPAYAC